MRKPTVADHLRAIQAALAPQKIRWFVFGAQAVIAAGAVRQTADLDITTDDVPAPRLIEVLSEAGLALRDDIEGVEDLVEHHRILPMVHTRTGYQVDVVRAGPGLEQQMFDRSIRRRMGRMQIPFVETNDLLVQKTLAGREKDLEDVRSLLRSASKEIDLAIVRSRLRELGALIDDSTLVALFELQVAATSKKKSPRRRS
ncbi:MAG: hypothetical protein Q8L48_13415 [Archangium sp.]|nr:hypothetical protein [Archangium sp.]